EADEKGPIFRASFSFWCGRGDSNPHGIATASPSSWCVCQFRHFRESCEGETYFGCGCAGVGPGVDDGCGVAGAGVVVFAGAPDVGPPAGDGAAGVEDGTGVDTGGAGVPVISDPELPR